nr:hypothetical protein [Tanacetum cinerariifolium]
MVAQMIGEYLVQTRYDNGLGIARLTFKEAIAFEMKRIFLRSFMRTPSTGVDKRMLMSTSI